MTENKKNWGILMKNKKKIIQRLAWILVGGSMLTGCAGQTISEGESDPSNPTTVTIWHYYSGQQEQALDELIKEFNAGEGKELGIVVSAENKGTVTEIATAVSDAADEKIGADELPEIFASYTDTAYFMEQENADVLADIGTYMSEEEVSEYVEAFWNEGVESTTGKTLIFPIAKSTELLYLDQTDWDVFAAETGAEISDLETWEGLAKVAEAYYNWSDGKAFFGRDAFANYLIVGSTQLGHPILNSDDGKLSVELDKDTMRRLWDNYAVPYLKGYYAAYGKFRSDDVKTGDLIAFVGSTSSVTFYPREVTLDDGSVQAIEGEVYALPDFEGSEPYSVQQGAGMAVVRKGEKTEKAAIEFLKWFTEVQQNTQFSVKTGYIPVKTEANTEKHIEAATHSAGYEEGSLQYKNIFESMEVVQNSTMCTNPMALNSSGARDILGAYMSDKLDEYKAELTTLSEAEREDRINTLFDEWISGMDQELKMLD